MIAPPPRDHAGVVAPAPVFYLATLAAALLAEWLAPRPVSPTVSWPVAGALIAVSVALAVAALRSLARAQTAFDARKATTALVTTGVFHLTRNPTYLSLALLQIGLALVLNSMWALLSVIPAVVATHLGVILPEERYLAAKFGQKYIEYASRVRRWV